MCQLFCQYWQANMDIKNSHVLAALSVLGLAVISFAVPVQEQEYLVEAYQRNGDTQTLILKLRPRESQPLSTRRRQSRQDEEDTETSSNNNNNNNHGPNHVVTAPPYIPAVLPALTQIFTGIITGNLNDIFHGSTSFAPQNISHIIDSVYNRVVGLQDPIYTPRTTPRALSTAAPVTKSPTTESPASSEVVQPSPTLLSSGENTASSVSVTTSASKTTTQSNNDEDDDEFIDARAR